MYSSRQEHPKSPCKYILRKICVISTFIYKLFKSCVTKYLTKILWVLHILYKALELELDNMIISLVWKRERLGFLMAMHHMCQHRKQSLYPKAEAVCVPWKSNYVNKHI
jgi:hypothetical protein